MAPIGASWLGRNGVDGHTNTNTNNNDDTDDGVLGTGAAATAMHGIAHVHIQKR